MAIPLFPVENIPNRATDGAQEFTVNADLFCSYVINTLVPGINSAVMGDVVTGTFNALTVNNNALISGDLTVSGTTTLTGAVTVSSASMTVAGGTVYRSNAALGVVGAIIEDQKAIGTSGGTFTSGADQVRALNTFVSNDLGLAALSSNRFTLPAGKWLVEWSAPAYRVDMHRSLLYNVTDAATIKSGTSERSDSAGTDTTSRSVGMAIFTISGSKEFEIRHRCNATFATNGFGQASGFGTEVYTQVKITKIA
jgi:hypothetical protein